MPAELPLEQSKDSAVGVPQVGLSAGEAPAPLPSPIKQAGPSAGSRPNQMEPPAPAEQDGSDGCLQPSQIGSALQHEHGSPQSNTREVRARA